jgi:hypothetical protein
MLECSDSDRSSINSKIDSDHSVDDIAVVDTLVNDHDDDNEAEVDSVESFVWEDMSNYKGQREQFRRGSGCQGATKEVHEIAESFELFSTENLFKKLQKRPSAMLYNFKIPGEVCSHGG